ncbi:hypothetical protein ACJX0J_031895, partial [Zea mays]
PNIVAQIFALRAGVVKVDAGTTLFLVPPSDFLTNVSAQYNILLTTLKASQDFSSQGQQQNRGPGAAQAPEEDKSKNLHFKIETLLALICCYLGDTLKQKASLSPHRWHVGGRCESTEGTRLRRLKTISFSPFYFIVYLIWIIRPEFCTRLLLTQKASLPHIMIAWGRRQQHNINRNRVQIINHQIDSTINHGSFISLIKQAISSLQGATMRAQHHENIFFSLNSPQVLGFLF